MALLPVSIAVAAIVAFCAAVILWPIAIGPALRRRYEREHHRRKAARAATERRDRA